MHRLSALAGVFFLLGWAVPVSGEPATLRGEVIDVQCHLRSGDNVGEDHEDCALSCAKKGATMGILAEDGVYIITGEFAAAANEKLIEFVARQVEATGEVTEREGTKLIEIASLKRLD
jgi:hypothetical protein